MLLMSELDNYAYDFAGDEPTLIERMEADRASGGADAFDAPVADDYDTVAPDSEDASEPGALATEEEAQTLQIFDPDGRLLLAFGGGAVSGHGSVGHHTAPGASLKAAAEPPG